MSFTASAAQLVTGEFELDHFGKVIVTTAVAQGAKSADMLHRWEIHCFEEESGKRLWTRVATEGKPRVSTHRDNTYASETPSPMESEL